jgi:hypothetical protein
MEICKYEVAITWEIERKMAFKPKHVNLIYQEDKDSPTEHLSTW